MTAPPGCDDAGPVIAAEHLSLGYRTADGWLSALDDVCVRVQRGEIFGLVGESGSGKTTLALQLLGYRDARAGRLAGEVIFDGRNLSALADSELAGIRGRRISYVPQNPTTALNPGRRVGRLIAELLRVHDCATSPTPERARVLELLADVGLPTPAAIAQRYPHQLSGGQQQRVTIAMALACRPDLIVLDEPTTGLDVTTQRQILRLLMELRARFATAMVYVTHDLGVIEEIADRVGVMYAGVIVESGATQAIFNQPRHPYTAGLIASVPRLGRPLDPGRMLRGALRREAIGQGCRFEPRCPHAVPPCRDEPQVLRETDAGHLVACREWQHIAVAGSLAPRTAPPTAGDTMAKTPALLEVDGLWVRYGVAAKGPLARLLGPASLPAVRNVSFTVARGEVFALVGESGSGKSTIARAISGLLRPAAGKLSFEGATLPPLRQRSQELRRRIQFIFQNPDASLNPRRTIGESLRRPLALFHGVAGADARRAIERGLEEVQLPPAYARRFPDELSGGERQRAAIARALLARPDLILCDEVLSALDVSVQANILELLRRLRRETGVAMLFIAHDLAVVEQIADRIGVLYGGEMVDCGSAEAIFATPHHPYTLSLLQAVPGGQATPASQSIAPAGERRLAGSAPARA